MGEHINADGEFQSDKYPTCPAGKVPLSTKDVDAQDLLWEYAERHEQREAEFSEDLKVSLENKGFSPDPIAVVYLKALCVAHALAEEGEEELIDRVIELATKRLNISDIEGLYDKALTERPRIERFVRLPKSGG